MTHLPLESIRLAFIVWSLKGLGGSEKIIYDLSRNLLRYNYHIYIFSFEDGDVRKLFENIGVQVLIIPRKAKFDRSFLFRFRKALLRSHVDIINPHHFSPLLWSYLAVFNTRIRLVSTQHSVWEIEAIRGIKKLLFPILIRTSDAVVSISQELSKHYSKRLMLPKGQVHEIFNGVDLNVFKPACGSTPKKNMGFEANDRLIGLVANLRPEKNHKVLISAFTKLLAEVKDVHLVLIGRDYMNGELQSFSQQLGATNRIHFLGPRKDVANLLTALDVFCLPSRNEGMPLSILEAMAAGVPVVGSDVPGINEVIENDRTGALFPHGDERKLQDCLRRFLLDREYANRISNAAREHVMTSYSLERQVAKYDLLFRNLMPSDIRYKK